MKDFYIEPNPTQHKGFFVVARYFTLDGESNGIQNAVIFADTLEIARLTYDDHLLAALDTYVDSKGLEGDYLVSLHMEQVANGRITEALSGPYRNPIIAL